MLDLLRDQIWEFVGVILPLILILTRRKLKGLSYHVIEDTTLVKVEEQIASRVRTLFDGRPVGEVRNVTVKLVNVGHIPIKTKDYEEPIAIDFGKGVRILKAKINEVRPANLRPVVRATGNRVLLKPIMLQSGEYVTVTVLVSNSHQPFQVLSRIIGITEITNYLSSNSYGWYWRQLRGSEFRGLFQAWSVLPLLFGLMGLFGMLEVRGGNWLWLWLGSLVVWYSLLALIVGLVLAAVPLVIRPLKKLTR